MWQATRNSWWLHIHSHAASAGDTILVAAGTYHESLLWSGKDLTLQGAGEGASFIDPGGLTAV